MTDRYTNRKGRVFSVIQRIREDTNETHEERERRIMEELYRILIRRGQEDYGNCTVCTEVGGEGKLHLH